MFKKKKKKNLNCSNKGAEREGGLGAGIRDILEREKLLAAKPGKKDTDRYTSVCVSSPANILSGFQPSAGLTPDNHWQVLKSFSCLGVTVCRHFQFNRPVYPFSSQ